MSPIVQRPDSLASGVGLAALSATAFGSSGVGAKALIEAGWTPGGAVLARLTGAALILLIVGSVAYRGRWPLRPGSFGVLLVYGAVAMAGTQFFYFNAVRTLDVGVALLIQFLAPVLLLGWTALRTRTLPRRLTLMGAACALVGLVFVIDPRGAGPLDPVGVAWALGAAVGLSAFFVLSSRDSSGLPALVMAAGGTFIGAVIIGAAGLTGLIAVRMTTERTQLAGSEVAWWVPMLWLVLVATVIAYLSGIGAIMRLGSRVASFAGLTEVPIAVLIAWVVLSEMPGTPQLVGGILILCGIVLVQRDTDLGLQATAPAAAPAQAPTLPAGPGEEGQGWSR
jgi:drug/metabolite transporter (DMT)-like permease